jgi:hypothetical protein
LNTNKKTTATIKTKPYLYNKREPVLIEGHEAHAQLLAIRLAHGQNVAGHLQPLRPTLQHLHLLALGNGREILAHL